MLLAPDDLGLNFNSGISAICCCRRERKAIANETLHELPPYQLQPQITANQLGSDLDNGMKTAYGLFWGIVAASRIKSAQHNETLV